MRITNSMMINNLITNLGKNATRLTKYQNQLQTGKKFNQPSDDPVAASYAVQYDTDIAKEDQYMTNVEAADEMLKATETALMSYNDVMQRVNELTVQASTATVSESARKAIGAELVQLKEELIHIANTTYNGRYLFSGYKTDKALINDDGTYAITVDSAEVMEYSIGKSNKLGVNVLGTSVFGAGEQGEKPEAFLMMDSLIGACNSNDTDTLMSMIDEVGSMHDTVLREVTDLGGKMNRLDLARNRITDNQLNLTEMKSLNEDVDIAEATTNFAMEQVVYKSALAAGSKVIQQTLLDFI